MWGRRTEWPSRYSFAVHTFMCAATFLTLRFMRISLNSLSRLPAFHWECSRECHLLTKSLLQLSLPRSLQLGSADLWWSTSGNPSLEHYGRWIMYWCSYIGRSLHHLSVGGEWPASWAFHRYSSLEESRFRNNDKSCSFLFQKQADLTFLNCRDGLEWGSSSFVKEKWWVGLPQEFVSPCKWCTLQMPSLAVGLCSSC